MYVCVSVTAIAATCLVYMSKLRFHTVYCRLLKICIVWTSLKKFRSVDMALFGYRDDWRLSSFLTRNTPMVLDTITNSIVYETLVMTV